MLAKRKWSADANCDRSVFDALQSIYSSLAQSVERMTVNHDVVGSSPTGGAILIGQKCNLCQKALFYKAFSVF